MAGQFYGGALTMALWYYNYPTEKVSSSCSDVLMTNGTLQERLRAGYSQLSRLNERNFPPGSDALRRFRLVLRAMENHRTLTDDEASNAIDNLTVLDGTVGDEFTEMAHYGKIIGDISETETFTGATNARAIALFGRLGEADSLLNENAEDLARFTDMMDEISRNSRGKIAEYAMILAYTAREWTGEPLTWGRHEWLSRRVQAMKIAAWFVD
jgi:hypothetical protein